MCDVQMVRSAKTKGTKGEGNTMLRIRITYNKVNK